MAAFIGFLAGQILALLLESAGAALAHYPGGLDALGRSANPPWWANALGLVGLWAGFAAAIAFAYREGHLRPSHTSGDHERATWSTSCSASPASSASTCFTPPFISRV